MRNRTEDQIRLVMIRHGATESNRQHRYLGRTDEGLSEEGSNFLWDSVRQGGYPQVDILFSSPMKRCLETARILYPGVQNISIPEWREIDFGTFEGKNYIELQGDVRYQQWIDSNGTLPFPEGESREAFIVRSDIGYCTMRERLQQLGQTQRIKTVGMIVHGGTIMSLLSLYHGGAYFDYQVPNGGGYICTLDNLKEPAITELVKL